MSTVAATADQRLERSVAVVSLLFFVTLVGLAIGFMNSSGLLASDPRQGSRAIVKVSPEQDPKGHAAQFTKQEIDRRFLQAVAMLHAKEYDHNAKAGAI